MSREEKTEETVTNEMSELTTSESSDLPEKSEQAPAGEQAQDVPDRAPTSPEQVQFVEKPNEDKTTERVIRIKQALRNLYEKRKGPLPYWEFVVHPRSYARTCENIFHLSILADKGHARIKCDEDGVVEVEPVLGSTSAEHEVTESIPCLVNMNMEQWQEAVKVLDVNEPSCSKLNNLSELVDVHIQTQETRLRATNAGRYTLMLLGYDIHKLPILPTKTSPWEITVLTDGKPLPRNMDPTQRVRRLTYAKRHAQATIVGNPLSIPSIPSKVFTRRESVLLRRLLTPFLLNRFHRGGTPPPASCPGHHKPGTLAFFSPACPDPTPPDRSIEFWRALLMFLQDPAAPPVGDRLRDSHKIQAAPT
ncbi:hypothetical protein HPB50_002121 [Hyalomma asiaticum]|uniref:Uncharacterized protein n=1 Tax=Hyalomma asiaticum TaxID=266040 RepID=A0ACB7TAX5_HYAAI|nr:hypothetical protein HPB50_002121 [Hyalomma asiaticum]